MFEESLNTKTMTKSHKWEKRDKKKQKKDAKKKIISKFLPFIFSEI